MNDIYDDGELRYILLEMQADKNFQRSELDRMMAEYLARGGRVVRMDNKGHPVPRFKYQNRHQRKLYSGTDKK